MEFAASCRRSLGLTVFTKKYISVVMDDRKKYLDKPIVKIVEIINDESREPVRANFWKTLMGKIKAKLFRKTD